MHKFHALLIAMLILPMLAWSQTSTRFTFETSDPNNDQWTKENWWGKADFSLSENGRGGGRCLRIAANTPVDSGWVFTIPVHPLSHYRLTGWIKTEDVQAQTGLGALINLYGRDGRTAELTGDKDWTEVRMEFETLSASSVKINCLLGGWGTATGAVLFDDLELTLIEGATMNTQVTINAEKKYDPISKYIYGQFIEHMGRCIYGGIWSEMLEDRKFLYPVTVEYKPYNEDKREPGSELPYPRLTGSPWRIAGPADGIVMQAENDWVKTPIPQVNLNGEEEGGVEQLELSLLPGKEYTGRIVLAGDTKADPIEVRLIWGDGPEDRDVVTIKSIKSKFKTHTLRFKAGAQTLNGRLQIVGQGKGSFQIAAVSLMPADNIDGFRPDVVALLKELDAPVYRWPGGNFVSGYEWREGIGDPDKRPSYRNPAWSGIETNDVGVHEYIRLCRLIGTEPMIAVNNGFGDAWSAMEEVEYCNGSTDTRMGQLRAGNGDKKPFDVKWWCVGNEMYGPWQLGHMDLQHYTVKHNLFVERMKSADPDITVIGCGNVGHWTRGMLRRCTDTMDLISEHFYCQENNDTAQHIRQMPDQIRRIANAHRQYQEQIEELQGKDIKVALDEWNYWYGPHVFGELGTRYFLKDALGIAAGLHEYFRSTDVIFMANYAQTVNVIGAIKATKTDSCLAATGNALKMYRAYFGEIPVEALYDSDQLDVMAAWTGDGKTLTIGAVNPLSTSVDLQLEIQGANLKSSGTCWILTGPDVMAYNEPGQPEKIGIMQEPASMENGKLTLPPLSATIHCFEREE
ncbi:alpha-L-arabinofuranosidase [Candidatus Sumerlaeota bacterium]|nr:alpha-L-arabinofuranosidase [Candidatus Sumerlaeota bacterium]